MPKFFVEDFTGVLTDNNAKHIEKSLRMKTGEEIIVCDKLGIDHYCKIEKIMPGNIYLKEITALKNQNEASINLTLYICFLKNDSLNTVIKHATELGVKTIVPVLSQYCVSRPNPQDYPKKIEKFQKTAYEASKQSGRGIIPKVLSPVNIADVPKNTIMFYEHGGKPILNLLQEISNNNTENIKDISILIGSEGGFSEDEANSFKYKATLGKRILKAETAPLAAITAIMLLTKNLE